MAGAQLMSGTTEQPNTRELTSKAVTQGYIPERSEECHLVRNKD